MFFFSPLSPPSFGVTLFKYSWRSLLCAPTAEFLIKLSKEIQYGPKGYYHKGQLPLIGPGHTEGVITSKHGVFTFSYTCGLEQGAQMRPRPLPSAFESPHTPARITMMERRAWRRQGLSQHNQQLQPGNGEKQEFYLIKKDPWSFFSSSSPLSLSPHTLTHSFPVTCFLSNSNDSALKVSSRIWEIKFRRRKLEPISALGRLKYEWHLRFLGS